MAWKAVLLIGWFGSEQLFGVCPHFCLSSRLYLGATGDLASQQMHLARLVVPRITPFLYSCVTPERTLGGSRVLQVDKYRGCQ